MPALGGQPVDDADQLGATRRRPGGQPHLPAELGRRLEQDDRVPALGRDPGRLQAGRPAADHDDPLRGPSVAAS